MNADRFKYKEILKVALKLFSAKGFHNVSMHEIAEKSEFFKQRRPLQGTYTGKGGKVSFHHIEHPDTHTFDADLIIYLERPQIALFRWP